MNSAMVIGGTGHIGSFVCEEFIRRGVDVVAVSRDDTKLHDLRERHPDTAIMLADITNERDLGRIERVFISNEIGCIVNAAAIKHVVACEESIEPAVRVNTLGAASIATMAMLAKRPHVYVSTDKAVNPINVLGMTKAIGERLVLQCGGRVVRFGNIIGSRGSVIPTWKTQMEKYGRLKVTGMEMKRWWIRVEDAAAFICDVAMGVVADAPGVFVPANMEHKRVVDVMREYYPDAAFDIVPPAFGEKQDEDLYWDWERPEAPPVGEPGPGETGEVCGGRR